MRAKAFGLSLGAVARVEKSDKEEAAGRWAQPMGKAPRRLLFLGSARRSVTKLWRVDPDLFRLVWPGFPDETLPVVGGRQSTVEFAAYRTGPGN